MGAAKQHASNLGRDRSAAPRLGGDIRGLAGGNARTGPCNSDCGPELEAQVVLEVRHVHKAVGDDRHERHQHPEVQWTPLPHRCSPAPPAHQESRDQQPAERQEPEETRRHPEVQNDVVGVEARQARTDKRLLSNDLQAPRPEEKAAARAEDGVAGDVLELKGDPTTDRGGDHQDQGRGSHRGQQPDPPSMREGQDDRNGGEGEVAAAGEAKQRRGHCPGQEDEAQNPGPEIRGALLLYSSDFRTRVLSLVFLAGAVPAALLSFSRGGYLALAAVAIVLALSHRWRIWLLAAMAAAALVLVIATPIGSRIALQFQDVAGNTILGPRGRLFLWSRGLEVIREQPLVGAGLSGFYPHNIVLNFWVATGLLGLLAFGWLLVATFLVSWRGWREGVGEWRPLHFGVLIALLAIVAHGLVDVPYFKNDLSLEFWAIVGIAWAGAGVAAREPSEAVAEPVGRRPVSAQIRSVLLGRTHVGARRV